VNQSGQVQDPTERRVDNNEEDEVAFEMAGSEPLDVRSPHRSSENCSPDQVGHFFHTIRSHNQESRLPGLLDKNHDGRFPGSRDAKYDIRLPGSREAENSQHVYSSSRVERPQHPDDDLKVMI
jgi:hypothetical protein